MRKIADYKGPTATRGPRETEAVKKRVRQLTQSTDKNAASTRASGAELNRKTERYPGMEGKGTEKEMKFVKDRTKRSMREVTRAGAKDAAESAASASAKKAATSAALKTAARAAGPIGAAIGVADTLRQGVKSQAGQNAGTVNTRYGKKTRSNPGVGTAGRGGKR
jgi:hypothetical protein